MKREDLIMDDVLFGLTQKYFGKDYATIKTSIVNELKRFSN